MRRALCASTPYIWIHVETRWATGEGRKEEEEEVVVTIEVEEDAKEEEEEVMDILVWIIRAYPSASA